MNIAEILKYCPKGTELYSTIYGEVKFIQVNIQNLIEVKPKNRVIISLFSDGKYNLDGECVLFPSKDQRDWSKFRLPVKKGDIMMDKNGECPFIASGTFNEKSYPRYICGVNTFRYLCINDVNNPELTPWTKDFYIPTSEEAKKKLFDKMAEAGYRWNAETLELEKIETKFKEGDIVVGASDAIYLISNIDGNIADISAILYKNGYFVTYDTCYTDVKNFTLATKEERNRFYSALVENGYKYDKKQHKIMKQEFKPFDKVLVRDKITEPWEIGIFSHHVQEGIYKYYCMKTCYRYCIPYEGNEYLLGTNKNLED